MHIARTGQIWLHKSMKLIAIPFHLIQSHRCMIHIKHLKLPIDIACRKNQITAMRPLQAISTNIVWLRITHRIIPSSILQHHHTELALRIRNSQITIIYMNTHLLMTLIDINVSIRTIANCHIHLRINYHKTSCKHRFILTILIINHQLIVATHGDTAVLIRNTELIMSIKLIGIERLFRVINSQFSIESSKIITHKQSCRLIPVRITMHDFITITMIVMRKVIKRNLYSLSAKRHHRH